MRTAEEYRELAKDCLRKEEESWERCGTDGFVSQFCNNLNSQLYNLKADLLEDDCKSEFWGLYDGTRRVAAMMVHCNTPYGRKLNWVLDEKESEKYGRKFVPVGARSRVQKKLGLRECRETASAWAKIEGTGTGISGLASCYVTTYRTGDKWGQDSTLIEEEEKNE